MNSCDTTLGLSDQAINHFRSLIQVNIDSRDGYREAMSHIDDDRVRHLFAQVAVERDNQGRALKCVLWGNFQVAVDHHSLLAAVHRGAMNMQAACGQELPVLLTAAVRIEEYVKQQYIKVIQAVTGKAVLQLLNEQLATVLKALKNISEISDIIGDDLPQRPGDSST